MPSRHHRITRGDEYRRITRSGHRVGGAFCIVHAVSRSRGVPQLGGELDAARPARFGYIVSKAVGNAVMRNLVRRRLKTVTERLLAEGLDEVDVVIRALPASATANFRDLDLDVRRSLHRALQPSTKRKRRSS